MKPMDIPKILDAVGCKVEVADPFDVAEAEKTLRRLLDQPGMNVLIMRQPCATLMTKERSKQPVRVYVDQDVGLGLPRQHLGLQEKQGAHRPRHLRGLRRVRQALPQRGD